MGRYLWLRKCYGAKGSKQGVIGEVWLGEASG